MPLSEREQRLLEQMERALYEEDPKFASTLRKTGRRSIGGRRMLLGILILLVGMVGLLAGVAASAAILGVAGFVVMLVGVLVGASALREAPAPAAAGADTGGGTPTTHSGTSSFMGKVEERWRRRRDGDGY